MKGILFKPDMIKAIVEGRKTQTRRVIKPQPCFEAVACEPKVLLDILTEKKSRYKVGETVYIKEAHCIECYKNDGIEVACYKYDEDPSFFSIAGLLFELCDIDCGMAKWRSPMFMPAWAARYFIKIIDVRAERLQEICGEDVNNEGVNYENIWGKYSKPDWDSFIDAQEDIAISAFAKLWNSINKQPYDWQSNPWVFAYKFQVVSLRGIKYC